MVVLPLLSTEKPVQHHVSSSREAVEMGIPCMGIVLQEKMDFFLPKASFPMSAAN